MNNRHLGDLMRTVMLMAVTLGVLGNSLPSEAQQRREESSSRSERRSGDRDSRFAAKTMIFTDYLKIKSSRGGNDVVRLGRYHLKADGSGYAEYTQYDATQNVRPVRGRALTAPIEGTKYARTCEPGPVWVPAAQQNNDIALTWTSKDDVLTLRIHRVVHEWRLDDTTSGLMRRKRKPYAADSGAETISGVEYIAAAGYAFVSEELEPPREVGLDSFAPALVGEYFQSNEAKADAEWWYGNNSLRKALFKQNGASRDAWSETHACSVESDSRCHTTIAFNQNNDSREFFIHGGHDYNKNGCMDETNHTTRAIGLWDKSGVMRRAIYAEYSWQDRAQYPILTIGHYQEPSNRNPRVQLTGVNKDQVVEPGLHDLKITTTNLRPDDKIEVFLWNGPFKLALVSRGSEDGRSKMRWRAPLMTHESPYRGADKFVLQTVVTRDGTPIVAHKTQRFTIPAPKR